MARRPIVLVTGAAGEMGHDLVRHLTARVDHDVVALDTRPIILRRRPARGRRGR